MRASNFFTAGLLVRWPPCEPFARRAGLMMRNIVFGRLNRPDYDYWHNPYQTQKVREEFLANCS
jgi:hypothetical protein